MRGSNTVFSKLFNYVSAVFPGDIVGEPLERLKNIWLQTCQMLVI